MYSYRATTERIIDGDTIVFTVDCGFYVTFKHAFRLEGIDTAEIRGKERTRGLEAKAVVEELCPVGSTVTIRTKKAGKYGRWIARVELPDGEDLAGLLVSMGFHEE